MSVSTEGTAQLCNLLWYCSSTIATQF